MRAVLAIVAYVLAAGSGLALGYLSTAVRPGLAPRVEAGVTEASYDQALAEEFAKMEAAAAFLSREEQRSAVGAAYAASSSER